MNRDPDSEPAVVPFKEYFAVLGYAVFCLTFMLGAVEGGSWLAWRVYRRLRSPDQTLKVKTVGAAQARTPDARGRQFIRVPNDVWTDRMGGGASYQKWIDQMSAGTAYAGMDWADEFWTLERQRLARLSYPYEPFRVWGMVKWKGKFVNNDQTELGVLRRTVNATNSACSGHPPLRVWVFGGSTVWGLGAPDSETMPSQLARQINAGGKACVEVTNFGVDAYVTSQELIFLIQELKVGYRPAIVIFCDGVNDAYVGGVVRLPGSHNYFLPIKMAFETGGSIWSMLKEKSNFLRLVRALRRRLESSNSEGAGPSPQIKATVDNYEANIAIARVLGEKYGFKTWFFWQPVLLYGKKPLDPFEQALYGEFASQDVGEPERKMFLELRAVYQEAENRSKASGNFIFLGHLFDDVREPIYIDWMHLGPHGNEILASAITERLKPALMNPEETSPTVRGERDKRDH